MVALGILGYLVFLMTGTKGIFQETTDIYTYLDDSAAIAQGAPVRLNGILIGEVSNSELSGSNDPGRVIRVTMQVRNEFLPSIPVDSQATIAAENLLGTKYINIKKGSSQQTIQAGAEVKSLDTREFDEVVQQGYNAIAGLNAIIGKVNGIVDQVQLGKGSIGKLLVDETLYNNLMDIVDEGQKLAATLNSNQGTLGRLMHDDQLYNDAHESLAKINQLIDGLNAGEGTAGKFIKDPALYNDLRSTIADLRTTLDKVNNGDGTVSKLLNSDELHEQIKGTIARLDTVLDKVNNGDGTIGLLMNNPALYESLDGTTRELQGLLRDFRSNPKKYLSIKLGLF